MDLRAVRHGHVQTNGIRIHYAEAGDGPPIVLLHGFPQRWSMWRYQLRDLPDRGFRVIAPDLRGYGDTDKPRGGYDVDNLVADVEGLAEKLGLEGYVLVGHDWGGPIAWRAAGKLPDVERLVQLNGPHIRVYLRKLLSSKQVLKSWYIYGFLVPGLAERILRARGWWAMREIFAEGRRRAPETITAEDADALLEAIRIPGALESGLKYYRGLRTPEGLRQLAAERPVRVPTLAVWGLKDVAIEPQSQAELRPWVDAPLEVRYLANAGHWLPEEEPDRVNDLIASFASQKFS